LVLEATRTSAHAAPTYAASILRAVGQMVDGDLARAVDSLGQAREARDVPEVDALAGLVALAGGQEAAALRRLSAAGARKPTEAMVYYWAARAALATRQPAMALRRMEEALAVGGDRAVLRLGYAILLWSAGRRAEARASLAAAAGGEPNLLHPSLYPTPVEGAVDLLRPMLRGVMPERDLVRTQGHLLWRAGRVAAAMARFRELRTQDATDGDAMQMLARCYAALGQGDEALRWAEWAVGAAPRLPLARAARGELLLERGLARKAVDDLRFAADAYPRDAKLLAQLARACSEAEQRDCASRFYAHALLQDAGLAAAHFGLALLRQETDPRGARAAFLRAMALDPGKSQYYSAAAHFAKRNRENAWARELLDATRRAEAVEKRQRQRVQSGLKDTALALVAAEQIARSPACEGLCRQAVRALPGPAQRFARAHLEWRRGQRQSAQAEIEPLLPSFRPERLLLRDPTLVESRGRTADGSVYLLRNVLPYVPAWVFRE
jgi:predicted Zn-dependent protease